MSFGTQHNSPDRSAWENKPQLIPKPLPRPCSSPHVPGHQERTLLVTWSSTFSGRGLEAVIYLLLVASGALSMFSATHSATACPSRFAQQDYRPGLHFPGCTTGSCGWPECFQLARSTAKYRLVTGGLLKDFHSLSITGFELIVEHQVPCCSCLV